MHLNFIDIFIIVVMQSFLLFVYHLLTKKNDKQHDIFKDKLEVLNSILKSTNHEKIYTLEKIKDIELQAHDIYVFSNNIYRDIKDEGQFSNEIYGVSTFFETVAKNLSLGKKYHYFLKKDANFRHSLISFFHSHVKYENTKFYIIPSEKYYFYDEVYLYEINGTKRAFEFLPSISDEKAQRLFYLELDEKQVQRLENIANNLIQNYDDSTQQEIVNIKSKLEEFNLNVS